MPLLCKSKGMFGGTVNANKENEKTWGKSRFVPHAANWAKDTSARVEDVFKTSEWKLIKKFGNQAADLSQVWSCGLLAERTSVKLNKLLCCPLSVRETDAARSLTWSEGEHRCFGFEKLVAPLAFRFFETFDLFMKPNKWINENTGEKCNAIHEVQV